MAVFPWNNTTQENGDEMNMGDPARVEVEVEEDQVEEVVQETGVFRTVPNTVMQILDQFVVVSRFACFAFDNEALPLGTNVRVTIYHSENGEIRMCIQQEDVTEDDAQENRNPN